MNTPSAAFDGLLSALSAVYTRFTTSVKKHTPGAAVRALSELSAPAPASHHREDKPGDRVATDQSEGVTVSGLTKVQAEELLDWLEVAGVRDCKVTHVDGEGFSVWYP